MTSHVRHEASDVSLSSVLGFGAGLVVSALVVSVLVWVLFLYFSAQAVDHGSTVGRLTQPQGLPVPPQPRLQTDPRGDLLALREAEDRTLTTYGWVNRNAGIVRIPIEQAMKLTVDRGLPTRETARR
jgi:uncharacterized iron-regulated membrane protein